MSSIQSLGVTELH